MKLSLTGRGAGGYITILVEHNDTRIEFDIYDENHKSQIVHNLENVAEELIEIDL